MIIDLLVLVVVITFISNALIIKQLDMKHGNSHPRSIRQSIKIATRPSYITHNIQTKNNNKAMFYHYSSLKNSKNQTGRHRPPLANILEDIQHPISSSSSSSVLTAAQFLLDFAIIGNGKCGTSSLQLWLSRHPEIECPEQEILDLSLKETTKEFITRLYYEFPDKGITAPNTINKDNDDNNNNSSSNNHTSVERKGGYKSPADIRVPRAIRALATYFPKTVLIIGIRHPVLWFEVSE
jgi:hypothetical protein